MSLPTTHTFGGTLGALPNVGDETNWAYNRTASNFFTVVTGGYCQASDPTVDTMMRWTGDTFSTGQFSRVVMGGISVNGSGVGRGYGPCVRLDTASTNKTGYRLVVDSHGWEWGICNNPTFTSKGTGVNVIIKGDTVEISVVRVGANDIVSIKLNGAHIGASPFTVTSPLTGGAAGIGHSSTTSAGAPSDWGIDSVVMGNVGYTLDSTTSGIYTYTGIATILRPGSNTYLRYRK